MAPSKDLEVAGFQFEDNGMRHAGLLLGRSPNLLCQLPNHRFGFGQQQIALERILSRNGFRGSVRNNRVFVNAAR
jgi:hypothetical protein